MKLRDGFIFKTLMLVFLIASVLFCCLFAFAESGECGENVRWDLTDGVLTISGQGSMIDYPRDTPWKNKNVKKVVIEDGVTGIGEGAFAYCHDVTEVILSNTVSVIGNKAFFYSDNLPAITLPDSVTHIGASAFDWCKRLTEITIPRNVSVIEGDSAGSPPFYCEALTDIHVHPDNQYYSSVSGMLYNKAQTTLICCPMNKHGSIVVPGTVTFIGHGAFRNCSLDGITLPQSVTAIGNQAFLWFSCAEVIIPKNCTTIGEWTFLYSDIGRMFIPDTIHALKEETLIIKGEYQPTTVFVVPHDSFIENYCIQNGLNYEYEQHELRRVEAKEPTCTESGWDAYDECVYCSYSSMQLLPALGHAEVIDESVAPTCLEAGLTEGSHCERCNMVIVAQEPVAALGHVEVVDEAMDPTCTQTGLTAGRHCQRCEAVLMEQVEVPALGHREVTDAAVQPSCTQPGLTEGRHCARCNAVIVAQEAVAPQGHRTVVDAAVEATCTRTGLTEGRHCSVCNEVLLAQEIVPKTGHRYVVDPAIEPTCTEMGWTSGTHCEVCGEVFTAREPVSAKGHALISHNAVPATCSADGIAAHWSCDVCGMLFSDEAGEHRIDEPAVLPRTGHTWGEPSYVWAPDNRSITATHVCIVDAAHKEAETVEVAVEIASPTEHAGGTAVYTSEAFNTEGFAAQTKCIPIPKLKDLSVMDLPSLLTAIEDEAFAGVDCEAVILPDSCADIGSRAFKNCGKLIYVRVPAGAAIAPDAFEGCEDVVVDRVAD